MVVKITTDRKTTWGTDSNPAKPITFEILEPRILLSGDSLLIIAPDPLDSLLDTTPQVVQYAELLETNDQVQEEISQELDPSEALNADIYQPIFTFSPFARPFPIRVLISRRLKVTSSFILIVYLLVSPT